MDPDTDISVYNQIMEAITSGNVKEFNLLTEQYPDWPDNDWALGHPHDMATDSLDMFKAFVEHFPQTKDWDCGHMGNPVGLAAIKGDIPFLKYLIEELGHKANEGRFCYSPVLQSVSRPKHGANKKIIKYLKKHGATLEGEGVCYRKSHKLSNGNICWHKGGKPNYPVCSWSENEIEKPTGIFGRIRAFFNW